MRIKGVVDFLKKQQEETQKKAKAGTLRKAPHSEKELRTELRDFIASGSFKTIVNSTNENMIIRDAFGKNITIKPGETKKINWIGKSI